MHTETTEELEQSLEEYLAGVLGQKLQKELRLLREEMDAYITAKREALHLSDTNIYHADADKLREIAARLAV